MKDGARFTTVDEYIAGQPKEVQAGLKLLRKLIRQSAPMAEEKISYNMPCYMLHGMLAFFSANAKHYGLYAMPSANVNFKERLKAYDTSKGTVRLPLDKPIPQKLVTDIIRFRVKENLEKAAMKELAKQKKKK
jgi:uncharacterized protein YdhG (YjbR/CyaY superfamily)